MPIVQKPFSFKPTSKVLLIISPAVYAELVPQARNRDELDGWLRQVRIQVVPFTVDHAYTAGSPMWRIARLVESASVFWPIFSLAPTPSMKRTGW